MLADFSTGSEKKGPSSQSQVKKVCEVEAVNKDSQLLKDILQGAWSPRVPSFPSCGMYSDQIQPSIHLQCRKTSPISKCTYILTNYEAKSTEDWLFIFSNPPPFNTVVE